MHLIADLHIHSPYSRATSKDLNPESLYFWAQCKGVNLVGTGDFTHPQWLAELEEKLEPAEEGLWRLGAEWRSKVDPLVPDACRGTVRFVLQTEISTIYKKAGRTRKVHHLILLPHFDQVRRLNDRLMRIGNLQSDGRPILGLDSRHLLETVLEVCEEPIFIPAHVWTPWFSVFGSRSGFDDLEECYGELTPHITALETGLSSDPSMNWRWSRLDGFRIVSNSDAHSPSRLGREANRLRIPLSFFHLREALKTGEGLLGTIEFFPEEGKYHLDGHRKCGTRLSPEETRALGGICPVCGRPVTVGVSHRIEELADRPPGVRPPSAKPFIRLLGLDEILAEILNCGPQAKRVQDLRRRLLERWGPELDILTEVSPSELEKGPVPLLAEAIRRIRDGRVILEAGYDGQYGTVRLFRDQERSSLQGQGRLWALSEAPLHERARETKTPSSTPASPALSEALGPSTPPSSPGEPLSDLNPRQQEAVLHPAPVLLILAGPGTGKTLTLTRRISQVLANGKALPEEILAVTFTQRAAAEMRQRLQRLLAQGDAASRIRVETLHAFGYRFLSEYGKSLGEDGPPRLVDERSRIAILEEALQEICPGVRGRNLTSLMRQITLWRRSLEDPHPGETLVAQAAEVYERRLRSKGLVDYEDLLRLPVKLLQGNEELRKRIHQQIRHIFVDEFQDLTPLQMELIRLLRPPEGTLTVIGDPDQSIYGFRGVRVEDFLRFQELFPDVEVLRLEENYRSTGTLILASMELISHNPLPFPRVLRSRRGQGPRIQIRAFETDRAEAVFVAHEIGRLLGGTSHWDMHRGGEPTNRSRQDLSFGDVAVLYRFHALGGPIEEALSREGLPYQRFGDHPLGAPGALEGLMAFLRWLSDPNRDLELLAALKTPSLGLSPALLKKVEASEGEKRPSLWERLQEEVSSLSAGSSEVKRLRRILESFDRLLKESHHESIGHTVRRSLALLGIKSPEEGPLRHAGPAAEILQAFLSAADAWKGPLEAFLDLWSLQTEADLYDPRADRIALLTVHAAKGLEFPIVFVVGCEEGVFPPSAGEASVDMEEERRLFYVAMTRARDLLYLTRTRSRTLWGATDRREESRFLRELPPSLLQEEVSTAPSRGPRQLKLF